MKVEDFEKQFLQVATQEELDQFKQELAMLCPQISYSKYVQGMPHSPDVLICAFSWVKSEAGSFFWGQIHDRLLELKAA